MRRLPQLSLHNRSFIALVCVVITAFGALAMTTLRQELIPSVSLPMVVVVGTNPGATSEQMADAVGDPVERQLRTLDNVEGTSTTSQSSVSMVQVELEYGSDIYRAAAQTDVLLNRISDDFPEGTTTQVLSGGSGDMPAMIVAVSSDLDMAELARRLEASTLSDLGQVPGVAQATVLGAPEEIVALSLDEEAMGTHQVSQQDITDALDNAGVVLPGGQTSDGNSTLDITVGNAFENVDDFAKLVIVPAADGASPVQLDDIAKVERKAKKQESASRTDGRESVTIMITPANDANFVEISDGVSATLDEATDLLGEGTQFHIIFDQAPYIQQSIKGLAVEGAWGLLFAVVVIFVFLWALKPTLITAISIPLSLLFAFVGMLATGETLNMMSLAGLMLAIGRMVDDSIVVVENISRHLATSSRSRFNTIVDAVGEVAAAVVSSTLVAMLVFVPMAIVPGMAGELFRPFALTTVLALTGSLFVSLTIVPVLAYWFMRGRRTSSEIEHTDDDAPTGWLAKLYRPTLAWALRHRGVTLVLAGLVFAGSVALVPLLKINLLGGSGMNTVQASQELPAGSTLQQSLAAAEKTEQVLQGVDGVESIQTSIGNGAGGRMMSVSGPNEIRYQITTTVDGDQQAIGDAIEQALDEHVTSAGDAAGEIEVQSGGSMLGSDTVDVVVTGLDDEGRAKASEQITQALSKLSTVARVASDFEATAPALDIRIREDAAAQRGMSVSQATGMIAGNTNDFPIGTITFGTTDLDVHVESSQSTETVEEVRALDLGGFTVSDIADVQVVDVVPSVSTENSVRTITVEATPKNKDNVREVTQDVQQAVEGLDLPEGTTWEMGGVSADIDEAFTQLGLAMVAAILLIYVVLVWQFKSLLQPALLLLSVPFAVVGVVVALWVSGTPLGMPSLVGFLMLIGIVVTNAIVLIDLVNQYRRRGYSVEKAILIGGQHRVRPIIMTAAATIMAMIPASLGLSNQSSFVSGPMAITVIGGLVASTMITLIIVPVLYSLLERVRGTSTPEMQDSSDEAPAPRRAAL